MKRLYFLCATLSIFSLGATAQVALPLSVDKDVFNADSIYSLCRRHHSDFLCR